MKKFDPWRRPHAAALAMATATIVGLIGLFVSDGPIDVAAFVLAAAPFAFGAFAALRQTRQTRV